MHRTISYRRDMRNRKIHHRKYICKLRDGRDWYEHDGQYSKGKIHCGCGICKFGKKYGLPTIRDEREAVVEKYNMEEYAREA